MPLTRIAIGTEAVAAAKRQEKPTTPAVRQTETHFNRALGVFRSAKRCPNTVERRSSGITFASGGGSLNSAAIFRSFWRSPVQWSSLQFSPLG